MVVSLYTETCWSSFLILKCFNNSTFFKVVCITWKIKCWILFRSSKLSWTRERIYSKIIKQYGHAPSNLFASPPLCGQRYTGPCVYLSTIRTKIFKNMLHPPTLILKCYCSWIKISLNVCLVYEDLSKGAGLSPDPIFMVYYLWDFLI